MSAWDDPVFWAWLITWGGMVGCYAYVILVNSRKRWPSTTAHERLVHITTMDGRWMREQDRKARLIDGFGCGSAEVSRDSTGSHPETTGK